FISKPINWGVLGHRVRYILRASQAFNDLSKHQASLESAQRIAHLGSWEWDVQRNEVYWSAETFRILGLEPHSVPAGLEPFMAHVHADDRSEIQDGMRLIVKSGEFLSKSARVIRPDGSVRHVQMQGVGTLDSSGTVSRVAGTIQDVTELKEAEQRIRY